MKRRSVTAGREQERVDQAVIAGPFPQRSLGGEKVFILLERLIREPKRYQDLLEFLWLCFSLGFRGRYKVAVQDQGEFEQIYRRLYHVLHKLRGDAPFPAVTPGQKNPGRALSAHQSPDC